MEKDRKLDLIFTGLMISTDVQSALVRAGVPLANDIEQDLVTAHDLGLLQTESATEEREIFAVIAALAVGTSVETASELQSA